MKQKTGPVDRQKEKVKRIQAILLVVFAFLLAGAGVLLGREEHWELYKNIALGSFLLLCVLFALNLILGAILLRRLRKKAKRVGEMQEYFLARKQEAESDLSRTVKKLVTIRRFFWVYTAVVFGILILAAGAVSFTLSEFGAASICSLVFLYFVAFRIRPMSAKWDRSILEKSPDPQDYPRIYALAKRAADAVGKKGEIRILFFHNTNIGIQKVEDIYLLDLGVDLLYVLSEEELYQIFLHEFAHMTKESNKTDRETRLYWYITEGPSDVSVFSDMLFRVPDFLFVQEFEVYRVVSSVAIETIADRAMLQYGDPKTAASALAKVSYQAYFDIEFDRFVTSPYYEPETIRKDSAKIYAEAYRRAIAERRSFWDELLKKEIQARNASHPIFRSRLEALGLGAYEVSLPTEEDDLRDPFRKEVIRAIDAVDADIVKENEERYPEARKEYYLEPLSHIEAWKEEGEPLTPERIRPLVTSFLQVGKNDEAEALCDRSIAEIGGCSAAYAYFQKAIFLFGRYDSAGIEEMYRAIELNPNYIDEGIERIGEFCCRMGLQQELEEYRRRAVELSQKEVDLYSGANSLTGQDRVSEESLPDGRLGEILNYIAGVGEEKIRRVYLVRKVISDDYFSSCFVIDFLPDTEEETLSQVMNRIFEHLDTRPEDWQYSLFLASEETMSAVRKVKNSCVYDREKENHPA